MEEISQWAPNDVPEDKRDFCCKARSANEGFIAVAKNLRGFGRSVYRSMDGDRIWNPVRTTPFSLLIQQKWILIQGYDRVYECIAIRKPQELGSYLIQISCTIRTNP